MIKLVYVVHARDDVAPEEFHRYWLEEHGPLVASVAEDIRARKYVQSHTIETPLNQALVESRGMAPTHQGITEVWWESLEELQAAVTSPEGAEAAARLVEDEAKFIDFSRSTIFLTEEHTIFERLPGVASAPLGVAATRRLGAVTSRGPARGSGLHVTTRPNDVVHVAAARTDRHLGVPIGGEGEVDQPRVWGEGEVVVVPGLPGRCADARRAPGLSPTRESPSPIVSCQAGATSSR